MCLDPLTLTMLALSAGGTMINSRNQNAAIEAQNDANWRSHQMADMARRQEQDRQGDLEGRRMEALFDTAEGMDFGAKRAALDAEAEAALDEVMNARPQNRAATDAALGSDEGDETLGQVADRVVAEKRGVVEAASRLRAAAGQDNEDAITLSRGRTTQDILGDRMRGSLGAAQPAMNMAQYTPTVTPGSSMLGDILIGAGQIGASKAGYGQGVKIGAGGAG